METGCSFAALRGSADKSLTEWLSETHRPSLPLLIVLTRNLRVPLSRFLIEQIPVSDEVWIRARDTIRAERSKLMERRQISRREPDYPMTRTRLWHFLQATGKLPKLRSKRLWKPRSKWMSRGRSGISSAVWDIASAPWDNIGFQRLQPQYRPSESDGLTDAN